jgi:hypothetical protein
MATSRSLSGRAEPLAREPNTAMAAIPGIASTARASCSSTSTMVGS